MAKESLTEAAQEPFASKMGKHFKDEYETFNAFAEDLALEV